MGFLVIFIQKAIGQGIGIHPPLVEELMVPTEFEPLGFSQKMMHTVMTYIAT